MAHLAPEGAVVYNIPWWLREMFEATLKKDTSPLTVRRIAIHAVLDP